MKKSTIILISLVFVVAVILGIGAAMLSDGREVQKAEQTKSPEEKISSVDEIEKVIADMTIEEKVGQMFFVRCPDEQAVTDVSKYCLGGYVLFGRDFAGYTKEQVQETISEYQRASSIPLLIGVDEEGGTVVRISSNKSLSDKRFLSPQDVFASGGLDAVAEDTKIKAALLKGLGINMNLAPVCDISTDENDFIHDRSFGKGAEETAEYIKTVVSVMKEERLGSCLKHFPGYGNNVDTHTGIAYDTRPMEVFERSDFIPFEAGIRAGANSVLVSHNIIEAMNADMPASLSVTVHKILREKLLFDGVIMTDDLAMDAIGLYAEPGEAAVLAVLAGNDIILASDYKVQIPAVIAAVRKGRITTERLDESLRRILNLKAELGLLG